MNNQPPADDEHVAPGCSLFSDPTKKKPTNPAPVEQKVREAIDRAIRENSNKYGEINSPADELASDISAAIAPFLTAANGAEVSGHKTLLDAEAAGAAHVRGLNMLDADKAARDAAEDDITNDRPLCECAKDCIHYYENIHPGRIAIIAGRIREYADSRTQPLTDALRRQGEEREAIFKKAEHEMDLLHQLIDKKDEQLAQVTRERDEAREGTDRHSSDAVALVHRESDLRAALTEAATALREYVAADNELVLATCEWMSAQDGFTAISEPHIASRKKYDAAFVRKIEAGNKQREALARAEEALKGQP